MSLTIAYITARKQPRFDWFMESLFSQADPGDVAEVIIVDSQRLTRKDWAAWGDPPIARTVNGLLIRPVPVKPTVWQGPHRLTQADWWAVSAATNTAFCYCRTDWIACLDDRLVLLPGWLDRVKEAMRLGYGVCGTYSKVHHLSMDRGMIKHFTPTDGKDSRVGSDAGAVRAPGEWFFGCNFALPLEWALQVNGCDETCDGLSAQDCIFGLMLQNNGFPLMYDKRMAVVEDRTPEYLGPVMIRRDKGVSPNDKSHALVTMLMGLKRAMHPFDLRDVRNKVLAGEPFPVPTEPTHDWFDGQPLSEMQPG